MRVVTTKFFVGNVPIYMYMIRKSSWLKHVHGQRYFILLLMKWKININYVARILYISSLQGFLILASCVILYDIVSILCDILCDPVWYCVILCLYCVWYIVWSCVILHQILSTCCMYKLQQILESLFAHHCCSVTNSFLSICEPGDQHWILLPL